MAEGTDVPATPAGTPSLVAANQTATTQSLQVVRSESLLVKDAAKEMDKAVDSGQLKLDPGSAEALIKTLADTRKQVDELLGNVSTKFEQELKFGNNPVADAIKARFSDLAVGEDSSAVRVISRLSFILESIEDTVRHAVDTTTRTDDEQAEDINRRGRS